MGHFGHNDWIGSLVTSSIDVLGSRNALILTPDRLLRHMYIAEPLHYIIMLNRHRNHGSIGDKSCSSPVGKEHSSRRHELSAVSYRELSDTTSILFQIAAVSLP